MIRGGNFAARLSNGFYGLRFGEGSHRWHTLDRPGIGPLPPRPEPAFCPTTQLIATVDIWIDAQRALHQIKASSAANLEYIRANTPPRGGLGRDQIDVRSRIPLTAIGIGAAAEGTIVHELTHTLRFFEAGPDGDSSGAGDESGPTGNQIQYWSERGFR